MNFLLCFQIILRDTATESTDSTSFIRDIIQVWLAPFPKAPFPEVYFYAISFIDFDRGIAYIFLQLSTLELTQPSSFCLSVTASVEVPLQDCVRSI